MIDYKSKNSSVKKMFLLFFLILLAIIAKYIYMRTSEHGFDVEEISNTALQNITGGHARSYFGGTRLYGITYITNTIAYFIFGYRMMAMKLCSLFFFLVASFATLKASYDWLRGEPTWIKWLPACLIAFGPPVAQMWALRNRGGFIETWAAIALVLWLYGRWNTDRTRIDHLYLMGIISGLAIWAQPIALLFVVPLFIGVAWQTLGSGWITQARSLLRLVLATVVGVMPLIALNFLFNFNTFRAIDNGDIELGAHTWHARFHRLFSGGFPRLAGLKQQWSESWIIPKWLAIVLMTFFVLVTLYGLWTVVRKFAKDRQFDARVLAVAAIGFVILGNISSSWGSFQMEPRRLLLLYVPVSLLVVWALASRKKALVIFAVLWFLTSAWSNVAYVRANPNGFNHYAYDTHEEETTFLLNHGIDGVYANVWEGPILTFESHQRILWFFTPYLPGYEGFSSNGDFDFDDAAIFLKKHPGSLVSARKMNDDLNTMGIQCVVHNGTKFLTYYACDRKFNIGSLSATATMVNAFSKVGEIFGASEYANGSFDDLYSIEGKFVWSYPHANIPFYLNSFGQSYLCIRVDRPRRLPIENIHLSIDGVDLPVHSGIDNAERWTLVSLSPVKLQAGSHVLAIDVPALVPATNGSTDPRFLGLPLNTINLVKEPASCN